MARSSGTEGTEGIGSRSRLRRVRPDGTPVYGQEHGDGRPPVTVVHVDVGRHRDALLRSRPHAHDFLVLVYVEEGSAEVRVDGVTRQLRAGVVHALSPGQVIGHLDASPPVGCTAWSVAFAPEAVPALASVSPLARSHHPLIALFGAGAGRAVVAEADRPTWSGWLTDLSGELADPQRLGAGEAVAALLSRLLVAAARLVPSARTTPDPLVERVFDQIEATYAQPVSARDVAAALGYTPGHLTTVVRQRTGRTLLEWITERRMAEARRLLRETELPLGVIASRTGLRDATYLVRRFRQHHGTTPERWRQAQRVVPS
jgi:AraC-like DNA-binding protein